MDLQANVVTIHPTRERVLDLAALPEAVRRSGFRPGVLRLRARGRFVATKGGTGFRIRGWPEAIAILGPAPEGEGLATVEAAVRLRGRAVRLEDPSIVPSDP